jgi:hypothetical protein
MKMVTRDGIQVMEMEQIERSGNSLLIRTVVMGGMPMAVYLTPEEARKGLRLLSLSLAIFLITFLFRRSKPGDQQ